MSKIRYRHIRRKVKELANKIEAPANLFPTYRFSSGDALPLIKIDKQGKLHYLLVERGQEFERRTTENLDELLYWIFSGITASMAFEYELKNRIEDKDCRRIAFDKQIELLSILNENWSKKEHEEHLQILKNHPFDDLAGLRATYYGELREKGLPEDEIEKLVFEKYPEYEKNNR
ncbi:Imm63 family immunity protein [Maribellus sp. YY47]|uniref:Imm63 family immunity protein n=1 Tax=Maribellus sp. YY47 TaxID=2929486 RepID=UPI002001489E|nr:Imm63 family immunity protein [Maribellus sp. YY47]MCK3686431.1 Imm63 family immunity protein [Maribellus sp. YY47]